MVQLWGKPRQRELSELHRVVPGTNTCVGGRTLDWGRGSESEERNVLYGLPLRIQVLLFDGVLRRAVIFFISVLLWLWGVEWYDKYRGLCLHTMSSWYTSHSTSEDQKTLEKALEANFKRRLPSGRANKIFWKGVFSTQRDHLGRF